MMKYINLCKQQSVKLSSLGWIVSFHLILVFSRISFIFFFLSIMSKVIVFWVTFFMKSPMCGEILIQYYIFQRWYATSTPNWDRKNCKRTVSRIINTTKRRQKTQIKELDTYIHSVVLKMEPFISPKGTRLHKACEKQNKTRRATVKKHQQ